MAKTKYTVQIRLTKVSFVPTWQKEGESVRHTVIAESYIDIEALPEKTQEHLLAVIKEAYLEHLEKKYG